MESQDEHVLNAFMINARTLSSVLKAIQFRDTATCFISSTGLRVTVEQAKCVQANCFVKSDLFQAYNYNEDSTLIFYIDLNVLITLDTELRFRKYRDNVNRYLHQNVRSHAREANTKQLILSQSHGIEKEIRMRIRKLVPRFIKLPASQTSPIYPP
uniref:Uncharacterized protein n=1 Tax=Amphimedon queenslandica TaxID=400682 RepID=A0A1X7UWM5_AMPQE